MSITTKQASLSSSIDQGGGKRREGNIVDLAPPILFCLTLHCWRFRIFDLDPKRRAAPTIGRAKPLRHDALASQSTRLAKDDLAILLVMLIENDTDMLPFEELGEQAFAFLNRLTA